jgi:hypothetical protein
MQADRDGVEIVIEQVGVGVQRDLRGLVPEHPLQRKYIHPRQTLRATRTCGVGRAG